MSTATTDTQTDTRRGQIRIEPGAKRVRAYLGGEVVADSTRPVLVWEVPYYLPLADVHAQLLRASDSTRRVFTAVLGRDPVGGG